METYFPVMGLIAAKACVLAAWHLEFFTASPI